MGPIPASDTEKPDEETQKKAFSTDLIADHGGESGAEPTSELTHSIKDQKYKWQYYESKDDIIDLTKVFGEMNFVVAYAFADIDSSEAKDALLGIGSDDSVKVWLNGNLIHEKWIGRGVNKDNDVVPITFQKGSFRLLLFLISFQ